jgi:hypothetical protein
VDGGGGLVVRQPHLGEGARLVLADEDAIGGMAGHRHPRTGRCRAARRRNRRRCGPRRGCQAEPGAQIHHIEIAPRRQGRTGAAPLPIGDEIERPGAPRRAQRLAGDGDEGGQGRS